MEALSKIKKKKPMDNVRSLSSNQCVNENYHKNQKEPESLPSHYLLTVNSLNICTIPINFLPLVEHPSLEVVHQNGVKN